MKKLMFLLAAASLSSVAFAQQKSNSQNVLVGESVGTKPWIYGFLNITLQMSSSRFV